MGHDLNMTHFNSRFQQYIEDEGFEPTDNYRKRIKSYLSDNISGVLFIPPTQKNTSEQVVRRETTDSAVNALMNANADDILHNISEIAKLVRHDILTSDFYIRELEKY